MKLKFCVAFLFTLVSLSVFAGGKTKTIQTVPFVDPYKFVGDWYQIAHIPMVFEGGPCACARQRLTLGLRPDMVMVYNSCNNGDAQGFFRDIRGHATIDNKGSNSKLTVDFGLPWKGTYWIIGIGADYKYAVVTDKDGKSLYILSKTPTLSEELYNEAIKIAAGQNLNLSKLEKTDQRGCTYPQ